MPLQFDPPFSPLHTALLAASAAAAVFILARRKQSGIRSLRFQTRIAILALRACLLAALAVILFNPSYPDSNPHEKRKPPFVMLIDSSRSMCTPDADAGSKTTRYESAIRATAGNAALRAQISSRFDLRWLRFADRAEAAAPEAVAAVDRPNGDRTNLAAALAGALSATGPAHGGRILLVSDGRDTEDSFPLEAARAARNQGFAIHTVTVGRTATQADLQVVARRTQVYATPGQTVQIAAELRTSGLSRRRVRVDLLKDGRRVSSQSIQIEPGRREVEFPVQQPKKGLYRYAIGVDPLEEEVNSANNRATVFLHVTAAKARVLFLEGQPAWDSKFLSQALRADPAIALDVIYKLTESRYFALLGGAEKEVGITLPRTPEQMSRYDVILIGRGFEEFYDDAAVKALKSWVSQRGGCLVFLRGRADERTPALRELEPVTWSDSEVSDLRMRLTQEGRAHPAFSFAASERNENAQTVIRKLPPLITATRVQGEKALAVVLARGAETGPDSGDSGAGEMATLAYQRFGQGKVMALAGQGMWRWAFLPPDMQAYRRVYDEFWSQAIRWMVSESDFLPGQSLSLRTDRQSYAVNETVNFLAYRRGTASSHLPAVTVTTPTGVTQSINLARSDGRLADFTASYRPTKPGEYVASIGPGASTLFMVNAGQEEDLNRSADPDLMRQIAAAGGGRTWSLNDLGELPDRLAAEQQDVARRQEPRTAWDHPWTLLLLFALLATEWTIRRRAGLA